MYTPKFKDPLEDNRGSDVEMFLSELNFHGWISAIGFIIN